MANPSRALALCVAFSHAFIVPQRALRPPQLKRRAVEDFADTESGGPLGVFLRRNPLYKSYPSSAAPSLVGEDAAVFDYEAQTEGWADFAVSVGSILGAFAVLWVYPATGYGDDFVAFLEARCGDSHGVTLAFGLLFPVVHSGLAALRPLAEPVVGARFWRWLFASCSLPLAYSWIVYFIAHAHDGVVLWDGSRDPVVHGLAWCVNFASFFFLYPTVFNLKEVAAVEAPKVHLWETGIIRITRHPQAAGQVMWSAAHLAMVGSTFNALTGAGQESEIPNFKGSFLGRFPLVSADSWTSDHLLERSRSVDAFFRNARARNTHVEATLNLSCPAQALTMALLVAHHVFAAEHGDARLAAAHGDRFEAIKAKTSVVPFAAILDGRQEPPADYWKEFARAPYALIAAGTLGAYAAHPYMQAGAALVKNTGLVPGGILDPLFAP